jgi:excisionase family DNA binding protein
MKEASTVERVLLLTVDEVAEMLNVSVRKVWTMNAVGQLPPAVRLGAKSVRWREADIRRYVESL